MKKLLLSTIASLATLALHAETFHVDFSNQNIAIGRPDEISASVSTGPGVFYNHHYQHSWLMHYNGASFIEVTFTNNLPEGNAVTLDFIHLSSLVNGSNFSPISVVLNGSAVLKGYSPVSAGYQSDSFDITPFVKTGENKLRISLDSTAFSNYWIQRLEVNFK